MSGREMSFVRQDVSVSLRVSDTSYGDRLVTAYYHVGVPTAVSSEGRVDLAMLGPYVLSECALRVRMDRCSLYTPGALLSFDAADVGRLATLTGLPILEDFF